MKLAHECDPEHLCMTRRRNKLAKRGKKMQTKNSTTNQLVGADPAEGRYEQYVKYIILISRHNDIIHAMLAYWKDL